MASTSRTRRALMRILHGVVAGLASARWHARDQVKPSSTVARTSSARTGKAPVRIASIPSARALDCGLDQEPVAVAAGRSRGYPAWSQATTGVPEADGLERNQAEGLEVGGKTVTTAAR